MTEPPFQRKLEELQQHVRTLRQFPQENVEHAQQLLPELLAGLQHSMDELQVAAGLAQDAGSNGAFHGNGVHPLIARARPELHFRDMAERGSVLVRIMSSETDCLWVNQAWAEYTNRSIEDLLGEGWLTAVHPEDRVRCRRILYEAIDRTRLHAIEYRVQRGNGQHEWILEIGAPRLDSRGIVCGYLGTAIEISQHRWAETHMALQYAVTRVLSETESAEQAIAPILHMMCVRLGWDVGELWSVDEDEDSPRCAQIWASPHVDASALVAGSHKRVFPSCSGAPWQDGTSIWISDIALDALADEPEARVCGMHGMFRLPILVHDELCAILRFFSREIRPEEAAVTTLMTAIGTQIGLFLDRQRAVADVRRSEARKSAILEASREAVISVDGGGRVVEFNSAAETLFGYRRADAAGRELAHLIVPPHLREPVLAAFASYQTTGTSDLLGKRFEADLLRSDGTELPVEITLAPIGPVGNGDPSILTIFLSDASQRRESELKVQLYQDRLRSLTTQLLLVEENERRRLALDIHDGLTQTIALIQLKLSGIRRAASRTLAASFDEIEALVHQANHAARSISFELSPPVLHDLGLEPALRWLIENVQSRYGLEIVLEVDGRPKQADEQTRVILFRSIRELLINAAKHAGTPRVRLRLEGDEDQFRAAIEDDGVGMEPEKAGVRGSGLFSIQERLSQVGGSMSIESAPGKGTKVSLRAPLTQATG